MDLRTGQGVAVLRAVEGGYEVVLSGGGALPAAAVVLATPAPVTAGLVRNSTLSPCRISAVPAGNFSPLSGERRMMSEGRRMKPPEDGVRKAGARKAGKVRP